MIVMGVSVWVRVEGGFAGETENEGWRENEGGGESEGEGVSVGEGEGQVKARVKVR